MNKANTEEKLIQLADLFDSKGYHKAAAAVDRILKLKVEASEEVDIDTLLKELEEKSKNSKPVSKDLSKKPLSHEEEVENALKGLGAKMKNNFLAKLASIADALDNKGLIEEANQIDKILKHAELEDDLEDLLAAEESDSWSEIPHDTAAESGVTRPCPVCEGEDSTSCGLCAGLGTVPVASTALGDEASDELEDFA